MFWTFNDAGFGFASSAIQQDKIIKELPINRVYSLPLLNHFSNFFILFKMLWLKAGAILIRQL